MSTNGVEATISKLPRLNADIRCPNCSGRGMMIFYQADNVPVHSVLLMPTREEALTYPRGRIELGFCDSCGFISNTAFDGTLHEYSARYEAAQGYSAIFNTFHRSLAQRLIDTYIMRQRLSRQPPSVTFSMSQLAAYQRPRLQLSRSCTILSLSLLSLSLKSFGKNGNS